MSTLPTDRAVSEASREAWSKHLGHPPADDLRERLAAGSLAGAAHETALTCPDRPALEVDGELLTHGAVDERAGRMAGWLLENGLGPGDIVLLSSRSSVAFVVAYLGVLRAGGTALLANPAYTESELELLVADSGAVLGLAAGPGLDRLTAASTRQSRLRSVRSLEELAAPGGELMSARAVEPVPRRAGTPAILAYTSGTTGRPKAVPLSDANLLASIRACMLAWRWEPDDVLVHALPLFHQHGLGGVHAALLSGSKTVVRSIFDPADLCQALAAERASVLFAVPAIYQRLVEWEGIEHADLTSLRLAISGSAPLSPALGERLASLLGQLPLERYGLTESGLDVSNLYDSQRRLGLVGLALPGVEMAIATDRGEALPPGRDGEIVLRGPQVFGGYRSEGSPAFHPGGWFRTGDVGRIDPADGYLQITGRLRDLIITGGMNVYPREVELALEQHPDVVRAAVVGLRSERWGEEVVAALVPGPQGSPAEAELLDFARERLAPFKCPKRILIVDELPVNPLGKVVTGEVRKLFRGGLGGSGEGGGANALGGQAREGPARTEGRGWPGAVRRPQPY
jgi:malonyl-CoA/methylmalonyl-CoA synthetase